MAESLAWDDVEIEDEEISEEDINNAEAQGKLPAMKFLGTCERSDLQESKQADYTGHQASLKWQIDEVLELPPGTPASDKDKERFEGRFQFDNVLLYDPREAEWAKNRRILVAKRCGLIDNNSTKIPKKAFSDLIVGAQAIVTTEAKPSKKGDGKIYVNVAFDGYAPITGATSTDTFDDI